MCDLWMDVDAALSEVPVNLMPLTDDTDFKTREESVTYNQAGLDLVWNFVTTAGAMTQTAVTPTDTGGNYDWVNQGNGMYSIEIPASGGASINNDTEGFGWFTGYATGILPWRGPVIGFRAAGLNNALIDDAYSTTRGLAGTALPAAAADAAGGLPISDAGGLDLDAILVDTGTSIPETLAALATADDVSDALWNEVSSGHTTAGTYGKIVSDISTAVSALNDLSAADIRTALGMASANLDTQLDTLDSILAATVTNADGTDIAADIISMRAVVNILRTIIANKSVENEAGTSITYRNDADSDNAGSQSWNEATKTRGAYTAF